MSITKEELFTEIVELQEKLKRMNELYQGANEMSSIRAKEILELRERNQKLEDMLSNISVDKDRITYV